MQSTPLRILMSREGGGRDVIHGVLLKEPRPGELVQIYFDNGRYLRTSPVKRVTDAGDELVIETANSTYHLKPDPEHSN